MEIVKVEPSKDNEVEAISGATISSKATVSAVNDAIRFYKENIKGYDVEEKEEPKLICKSLNLLKDISIRVGSSLISTGILALLNNLLGSKLYETQKSYMPNRNSIS